MSKNTTFLYAGWVLICYHKSIVDISEWSWNQVWCWDDCNDTCSMGYSWKCWWPVRVKSYYSYYLAFYYLSSGRCFLIFDTLEACVKIRVLLLWSHYLKSLHFWLARVNFHEFLEFIGRFNTCVKKMSFKCKTAHKWSILQLFGLCTFTWIVFA